MPRGKFGLIARTLPLAAFLFAACGSSAFTAPPKSASPEAVLTAYLERLEANDCAGARLLTSVPSGHMSGDLCGATTVSTYQVLPDPASLSGGTEMVFAVTMTTTGTSDGSVPSGVLTWFYSLKRQPDGSWRVTSGGSGP